MKFINKLNLIVDDKYFYLDEYKCFNTRKNGIFVYSYLPLLFKIYHLEEILPLFFRNVQRRDRYISIYYQYLVELYVNIKKRMMNESKEIEINEENIIIIMFLWNIGIERKKEKEIEFLINSTVKVFDRLGRIEEEKEKEDIKEKENELIKKEDNKEERKKGNVNRKEMFLHKFLEIVASSLDRSVDKEIIKKDDRICKALLEIVKNHIKNKRCLIEKGNKKRIIEYVIYSYNYWDITSDLICLPSSTFPFSHDTISYILFSFIQLISYDNYKELKKDITISLAKVLNNYLEIIKIIEECDVKKEIKEELIVELNNNIINNMYKKISFYFLYIESFIHYSLDSVDISLFDKENNNILKRLIKIYFSHSQNVVCNDEKNNNNNNNNNNNILLTRLFIADINSRWYLIFLFLFPFFSYFSYSIFNTYYLINKSEEGCNLINILMKELSGEIIDRIKRREGDNSIKRERRRYERERTKRIFKDILNLLKDMMSYSYRDRNKVHLGKSRNKEEYKGKEKEIKDIKDYISDIIEEEDMRECLILYLIYNIDKDMYYGLSDLTLCAKSVLFYLFSFPTVK